MDIGRSEGPAYRPEVGAFSSFQQQPQSAGTLIAPRQGDSVELSAPPAKEASRPIVRSEAPNAGPAKIRQELPPAEPPRKSPASPETVNAETGTITFIETPPPFVPSMDLPVTLSATPSLGALDFSVPVDLAAKADETGKKEFRGLKKVARDLKELRKVSKEIAKNPDITADDEALKDTAARIKEIHKEIHTEAVGQAMSKELSAQLTQAHLVMMDVDSAKERIGAMHLKVREDKLAEVAGKVEPIFLEFYRHTGNVSPEEMKEVLDRIAELRNPDSAANIKGNKVENLHREQIWQTKMNLLDETLKNPVANGKPVEIDVEYYEFSSDEMIERLKAALDKGCAVRVLMDPGHLVGDTTKGFDLSPVTSRVRTISSLFHGSDDGNLGMALFPIVEFLGQKDELMHRKLFRVGDKVVLGGMNANTGSGENIDAAQLIEGPAAEALVKIYQRDVKDSSKTDLDSIYGPQVLDIIRKGTVTNRDGETVEVPRIISSRGMRDMLDIAGLEMGVELPKGDITEEDVESLKKELDKRGHDLRKLGEWYDLDGDNKVTDKDLAQFLSGTADARIGLTKQGGKLIGDLMQTSVNRVNAKKNVERLGDISLPDGTKKGGQTVILGDAPVEREALVLHAIDNAEKFIYIPTFVMTKNIAGALIQKKEQMKAKGKNIDIKVVIDSGLYPGGSTPNAVGYKALEDAGIPVKWAMMWRTSSEHARKIHAKEILTDKLEITGSTNFSEKALRKNWELSGASYFNDDEHGKAMRDGAVKDFNLTWSLESIDIDSKGLTEKKYADVKTEDVEYRKKEYRGRLVLKFLREIEGFSRQVGRMMDDVRQKPELQREAQKLIEQGMNEGYAFIKAIMDKYTEAELKGISEKLSGWQRLEAIRSGENLPDA